MASWAKGWPVHVTLIGGGWSVGAASAVYRAFVSAAASRTRSPTGASRRPRVAVVLVDEGDGVEEDAARYAVALRSRAAVETIVVPIAPGSVLAVDDLLDADGLLVGGGWTPAYADCLVPSRDELRTWLVEGRRPYAGFSAGAAIAATDAVVGGWRHDGRQVCPEDAGEDLDEVTVRPGLGLVPFTVEVHADTWSTAPRLVAALSCLRPGAYGYAIEENTAVVVDAGRISVTGAGRAHRLEASEAGLRG